MWLLNWQRTTQVWSSLPVSFIDWQEYDTILMNKSVQEGVELPAASPARDLQHTVLDRARVST